MIGLTSACLFFSKSVTYWLVQICPFPWLDSWSLSFLDDALRLFHNPYTLRVNHRNSPDFKYSHPQKPLRWPGNRC